MVRLVFGIFYETKHESLSTHHIIFSLLLMLSQISMYYLPFTTDVAFKIMNRYVSKSLGISHTGKLDVYKSRAQLSFFLVDESGEMNG